MWDLGHFRRMWREALPTDKRILMCFGAFVSVAAGLLILKIA